MIRSTKKVAGFTIVEMLIIAPIVLLAIGAFITTIVSMTGDVLTTRSSNALVFDIQDALTRVEQDVKLSTSYLAKNNITLTSPQGYDDASADFTNVGANGNMLILNALATTGNPLDATSGTVYLADKPNACTSGQFSRNTPMTINIIYFIKDNTLWRRTLMPSNYETAGCNTPWQQPSCTPGYSEPSFCKTQDEKLIEVSSSDSIDLTAQYFASPESTAINSVASDSGSTDSARYAAMQSTTTVGVSLGVSKKVAGKDISQSGSIRVTRLDVNASTIADVVPDVVPSAPTVVASAISSATPTTTTFTWATVPGATTYSIDYRVDAWNPVTLTNSTGSWTNGFSGQTTTTYSKTVSHGDKVYVRVTATSPAGSSGYGTSNITVPVWSPLILQNNWTDYASAGFSTASFTKTSAGLVVLKGLIKSGTATSGLALATLPAGYRPASRLLLENSSNNAGGRIDIDPNGDILFQIGSNAWYSLDGIVFMPSGNSFTNLSPLLNSWVDYGSIYEVSGYMTDSAGRIQIQGLVKSGVTTSGTPIDTLPAGSRPPQYLHMVTDSNNAAAHISIDTSGNILAKGYSNAFLSIHSTFFPASRVDGTTCTTQWCTPTLSNGWVAYGSIYGTPRYTKATDGMVHLKGLIKSGVTSSGADIMPLPAGYCPKQRLLLTTVANTAWSRIDVSASTGSGCTVFTGSANSTSATWTSLDDLKWLAES